MDETYDSFLDYLLTSTTGLLFIGGITMIVVIGLGFFVALFIRPKKGFRSILYFTIYVTVVSQLGMLIQGYWGFTGFVLFLSAIVVVGTTIRIILKRRAKN